MGMKFFFCRERRIIHGESPTSAVRLPFSHVQDLTDEEPRRIMEKIPEPPIIEQMHQMSQPAQIIEEMPYEPIEQTEAAQKY